MTAYHLFYRIFIIEDHISNSRTSAECNDFLGASKRNKEFSIYDLLDKRFSNSSIAVSVTPSEKCSLSLVITTIWGNRSVALSRKIHNSRSVIPFCIEVFDYCKCILCKGLRSRTSISQEFPYLVFNNIHNYALIILS